MGDLEKQAEVLIEEEGDQVEKERLLDFEMLCSTVALQTQGKWRNLGASDEDDGGEFEFGGGVFRMWEGEVLDCFGDRRIAVESLCCPCYRFGKNMRKAGFGPCFLQATVYLIFAIAAIFSCVAFIVTRHHYFMFLAAGFTISLGMYLGFYRTRIKSKFNIRGSDSSLDDCVYHLICPCCTLCQESRTLEMNNVEDGIWHGCGDTICIGSHGEAGKTFFELRPPPIVSA